MVASKFLVAPLVICSTSRTAQHVSAAAALPLRHPPETRGGEPLPYIGHGPIVAFSFLVTKAKVVLCAKSRRAKNLICLAHRAIASAASATPSSIAQRSGGRAVVPVAAPSLPLPHSHPLHSVGAANPRCLGLVLHYMLPPVLPHRAERHIWNANCNAWFRKQNSLGLRPCRCCLQNHGRAARLFSLELP